MARITVEDCLRRVPNENRFELIGLAVKLARGFARGGHLQIPEDNDKPTVLALRTIAAGLVPSKAPKEEIFTTVAAETIPAAPVLSQDASTLLS